MMKCEVCGIPASFIISDTQDTGSVRGADGNDYPTCKAVKRHYFCSMHKLPPRRLDINGKEYEHPMATQYATK